ncbi:protein PHLOEM PROTEIN 2-LIKE A9 [Musa acuminata AAA Group]|uniref:(wild Malaysian banana) hypothetical protein n=1 Tax=Musa acuminata subsp. malaccensis TaxID=214687 RepID=A0A804L798_MUSAM|nr:PREDICTED: protein PHLOEM PROTEIN 2-LIKE A9-like [Musa acuminata subsp. malaccensis]CAG1864433.1 unnamed protein product [Musa acuminata subsp. malaccensis]
MESSPHYNPQDKLTDEKVKREAIEISEDKSRAKIDPVALDVTWGNDPRHWCINKNKLGSITLLQVSWLEVVGKLDGSRLVAGERYKVKFMVKMRADAFGWSGCPVYLMAKDASGKFVWKKADLSLLPSDTELPIPDIQSQVLIFTAPPDQVVFGLFEIWRGTWKGGLEIVRVIIDKVPPDNFKR